MDALVVKTPAAASPAETVVTDCVHCALPIPSFRRARGDHFCCDGCARVYELIQDAGLERYYDLRNCATGPPASLRPDSLAWFDRLVAELPAGDVHRLTLDLQGVHCAACVWLLQELFRRVPGAIDLRINPARGRAEVMWREEPDGVLGFLTEAERFGYRFGPPTKSAPRRSRDLVVRLSVSAAAAMNAMIFSLSFYFGLTPADGLLADFFGWLNFGLGTVAATIGGWVFYRAAVRGLRRGVVPLDLPIAVGIALAWAGSAYGQLTVGPEGSYFDSLAVFVTLMLVGRWLQERQLERNAARLLANDGVAGLTTRVVRDGRLESIPAAALDAGDTLWIVPGDLVPVDATLTEAPSELSLDWIDGESRPRAVQPGDRLPAGSFNASDRTLTAIALQPFADSAVHDLLQPSAGAGVDEPGTNWGRLATGYVLAVFTLAALGFVFWLDHGAHRALEVTISILVVTCPCAIGLAIPLAHDLVHGQLRRRGVFVRRPGFFDRAADIRKILFDKTGTLTQGDVELDPAPRDALRDLPPASRAALFQLAASSLHPVSRAVRRALEETGAVPAPDLTAEVREVTGSGLEGAFSGETHRLGREQFTGSIAAPVGTTDTVTWSINGQVRARFSYGERLREDAIREVRALDEAGYEIYLVSGDGADRVAAAAAALGVPDRRVHAGCSPGDKLRLLESLDQGDALTIGDGLNDAPVIAASTCAATPAIDHAALSSHVDFYFLGDGIAAVRQALDAAHRLRRVIRHDLVFAALYNTVALALCFAGRVSPAVAAVLMPAGSLAILSFTFAQLSERRAAWK